MLLAVKTCPYAALSIIIPVLGAEVNVPFKRTELWRKTPVLPRATMPVAVVTQYVKIVLSAINGLTASVQIPLTIPELALVVSRLIVLFVMLGVVGPLPSVSTPRCVPVDETLILIW